MAQCLLTELGFNEASDFKIEIERRYIRIKMFVTNSAEEDLLKSTKYETAALFRIS